MTKAYLKFPKHSARLTSRRFPTQRAFLTDAPDILTKEGLLKHLDTMKEDLKTAITADLSVAQKTELEDKIKEKTDAITAIQVTIKELQDSATKPEILQKLQSDVDVTIKAFDLLQSRVKGIQLGGQQRKILTIGEAIGQKMLEIGKLDSEGNFKSDEIERSLASAGGSFTLKLGRVALSEKDMTLATTLTGDPVATYNPRQALIPAQKVNFRDLIPTVQSPTGLYVTYQENTGETNNIAKQTEGALKGQNEYALTEIKTVASYTAGFAVFTKQLLKFLPWMQSTLVRMLLRDFYKKENALFYTAVSGAATGAVIGGTDPNDVKQIISIIGNQLDTNFNVSYGVVNNALMARLISGTFTTGYYPGAGSVILNDSRGITIFGVPMVAASWVAANAALFIDADYIERIEVEGLNVTFSFEDSDNFRRNKVTAKVECMEEVNILMPQSIMLAGLGAS